MDLGFNEEQEMLRRIAREFLDAECPKAHVRAMEEDEKGSSPELWKKMAELGWVGLIIPEKYGGAGGTFLDMVVLGEEMGRALLPSPFLPTAVCASMLIQELGSEAQRQSLLPQIANGEKIVALALTEPSATYQPEGIELRAAKDGNDFRLSGTKLFVAHAHIADQLIVVARTGNVPEDISLFLVEANTPGISVSPFKTISGERQAEITFNNARVPASGVLGEVNKGWEPLQKVLQAATVFQCAEMAGGAHKVVEMSVDYAKTRVQFGRPIGSFQAIQHYCANMITDADGIKFLAYEAAWRVSEGLPAAKEVSMAKAWASDAYRRVTALGHQIHGGIGFTKDHDMQLYYRRAKAAELNLGDADFHREVVAQKIGLEAAAEPSLAAAKQ